MKCAVCVYVRNEERDIQEWIAYHKAIGFDAFLIYDNGSTDATLARVGAMEAVADVRVVDWSENTGNRAQHLAYADCCARFAAEFDWIAFIDSDEYLASPHGERVQALIARNVTASSIALNWAMFGSNGYAEFPLGLLIEAFDRRSEATFGPNAHTKMILRPKHMRDVINPHFFIMAGPTVDARGRELAWRQAGITEAANLDGWRVHHYFTRSEAHWAAKMARGYRDITRNSDEFAVNDRNEVRDRSAFAFAGPVLRLLEAARMAHASGGRSR